MVKKMILSVVFLALSTPLFAQKEMLRHEVSVSYGISPVTTWIDSYSNILFDIFANSKSNITGWGAVTVGYNYRFGRIFSLGAQIAYSSNKNNISIFNEPIGQISNQYWSIMPNAKLCWFNGGIVSIYSRVAAGVTLARSTADGESENSARFAFQLSPLGVEIGGRFSGYAETGIGISGCVLAGVRYRF